MGEKEGLRAVPKGVDDFKELRDGDYYYIDKTELISDIVSDRSKVFLFTRPRRFGKSLNLSMLDAFFNMNYKGNRWFGGLKISEHKEIDRHRNAYPVIDICMKDIPVEDYGNFISKIESIAEYAYNQFPEIYECDKIPGFMRRKYLDATPIRSMK